MKKPSAIRKQRGEVRKGPDDAWSIHMAKLDEIIRLLKLLISKGKEKLQHEQRRNA